MGTPLEARAAERLPALQQLLLPAQHACHPIEVAGEVGRAEALADRMQLGVQLGEIGSRGEHGLERRARVAERVLRQQRDDGAATADDLAAVRRLGTECEPEQRRLAGAVGADDADACAGLDGEVDAGEDAARAERFVDALQRQLCHGREELARTAATTSSSRPRTSTSASRCSPPSPSRIVITS